LKKKTLEKDSTFIFQFCVVILFCRLVSSQFKIQRCW